MQFNPHYQKYLFANFSNSSACLACQPFRIAQNLTSSGSTGCPSLFNFRNIRLANSLSDGCASPVDKFITLVKRLKASSISGVKVRGLIIQEELPQITGLQRANHFFASYSCQGKYTTARAVLRASIIDISFSDK